MPDKKLTDNEIKSNLEWLKTVVDRVDTITNGKELLPTVIDYINRLEAENEELAYKLGCLLCHATGGKLSKHTYPLRVMESYVNDTIQEYCEEAEAEAKAEAYKEFADRLKEDVTYYNNSDGAEWFAVDIDDIDNLLKEMVGE